MTTPDREPTPAELAAQMLSRYGKFAARAAATFILFGVLASALTAVTGSPAFIQEYLALALVLLIAAGILAAFAVPVTGLVLLLRMRTRKDVRR